MKTCFDRRTGTPPDVLLRDLAVFTYREPTGFSHREPTGVRRNVATTGLWSDPLVSVVP